MCVSCCRALFDFSPIAPTQNNSSPTQSHPKYDSRRAISAFEPPLLLLCAEITAACCRFPADSACVIVFSGAQPTRVEHVLCGGMEMGIAGHKV